MTSLNLIYRDLCDFDCWPPNLGDSITSYCCKGQPGQRRTDRQTDKQFHNATCYKESRAERCVHITLLCAACIDRYIAGNVGYIWYRLRGCLWVVSGACLCLHDDRRQVVAISSIASWTDWLVAICSSTFISSVLAAVLYSRLVSVLLAQGQRSPSGAFFDLLMSS